jgi:hypothetical protein
VPTNRYNGATAQLVTFPSGTVLYRILAADATYPTDSYNPSPRPLDHPKQGRFEPDPAYPEIGGYTYVAPTVAGAVAEGILRNQSVPQSGLARRMWLTNKRIATLRLTEDIAVAAVYGPYSAALNLDGSLLCCGRRGYTRCRTIGTQILLKTPHARGVQYDCRNNLSLSSLMLVTRGGAPGLDLVEEHNVLTDAAGKTLVLQTLKDVFGLDYTGR